MMKRIGQTVCATEGCSEKDVCNDIIQWNRQLRNSVYEGGERTVMTAARVDLTQSRHISADAFYRLSFIVITDENQEERMVMSLINNFLLTPTLCALLAKKGR